MIEPKPSAQTRNLQQEEDHLKQALTRCSYPAWAINKNKNEDQGQNKKTNRCQKNSGNNIQKPHMVIPYYRGISESLKNTCRKHGMQVYVKGGNTIKNFLMAPKDQDTIQRKSGVIYRYKYDREDQNLNRWIKEALFIRVNNPSLNKNIAKYHLPHMG